MPELVSIVVPCFNEASNVSLLAEEIAAVFAELPDYDYECVFVNDGSTDGTREELDGLAASNPRIRPVHQSANRGQSSALIAGFAHARGAFVLTMDADLQNDPRDFPAVLAQLSSCDCVFGFRAKRRDTAIRRFSGKVANAVRDFFLKDGIRDTGCGLKGFRRHCIEYIVPFDGIHRFLGVFMRHAGCGIAEIPVNHRPRMHGRSKYSIRNRLWRGCLDILGVYWLRSRLFKKRG